MKFLSETTKVTRLIDSENIVCCIAMGRYCNIYLYDIAATDEDNCFNTSKSLLIMEGLLPKTDFFRCRKNCIINFKYFHEFVKSTRTILMTDGTAIKLSKSKRAGFNKKLLEYFEKNNS